MLAKMIMGMERTSIVMADAVALWMLRYSERGRRVDIWGYEVRRV